MNRKVLVLLFLPLQILAQETGKTFSLTGHEFPLEAIITSFIFEGTFLIMGLYMVLLYIQSKKKDYLYYGIYLILFTLYVFSRIELTTKINLLGVGQTIYYHLLTPLLLALTGVYVKFIDVFAEIKKYSKSFSYRLNVFSKLMYFIALAILCFTLITRNFNFVNKYQYLLISATHIYTILAMIRAFIVIRSNLRYYVLLANVFLLGFSILAYYNVQGHVFSDDINSNYLYGFYTFNSTQLGAFLEMVCFSLGLGYKFNLVEKEKNEVKQKYIEQLKKNEIVTKQLNEELTYLVAERTKEIEAKNRLLKKTQEIRSNFFTNISHEFRTPLTLILGPIEKQLHKKGVTDDERKSFEMIWRNSNRLLSLVDQLLDLSKIEAGCLRLQVEKNNVMSFVGALTDGYAFAAGQKGLCYTANNATFETETWFDKDTLEKIVVNLLSNALKYTPKGGSIVCNALIEDGSFIFEVRNTGKGLSSTEIKKVFNRFYQINKRDQGAGIGLALVKELVGLHKGTISAESTPNEWTTFKVKLPVDKKNFDKSELIDAVNFEHPWKADADSTTSTNLIKGSKPIGKNDNPVLLIVDDNEDVRSYLAGLFTDEFRVVLGENGEVGIDMAIEHVPDLVICDVMMPVKTGLELCITLKTDERTSHIPVILLTAKADDIDKIRGLEIGADDYIVKPFNAKLLRTKVCSLLNNRIKLRAHYNQELVLKPAVFSFNKSEEKFFGQLQNIINNKLRDPDFHVSDFCEFIGMSRMHLHRKLKATLGVTATEFLRTERLRAAKMLLENSQLSVSEIAYSTGFNDANYFGKCFKKLFKISPTDYQNLGEKS